MPRRALAHVGAEVSRRVTAIEIARAQLFDVDADRRQRIDRPSSALAICTIRQDHPDLLVRGVGREFRALQAEASAPSGAFGGSPMIVRAGNKEGRTEHGGTRVRHDERLEAHRTARTKAA
jgi:hypothetical protein